ncbi:DUF4836 family protein [Flagellimonas sp. HMM57]|uniref:DUF4836 family protein n=1 Tax=unclassified Flagellimonas TaxID=2644544 RepID=UPI0013D0D34F|nr:MULTISPECIES: DUF4836 family protein [unclassified Flagellimonas]UII77701.1 DUF4836 family protein [Flagellimonas sp. HMM57]
MKHLYTTIFLCGLFLSLNAQDLARKIPSEANVVVTVKGKNVLELLSLSEFSNSRLGQEMNKGISRETKGELSTIEDLGFNLNENLYYFLQTKEGVFYNTFMIPMKSTANLPKLFPRERDEVIKDGTVSYVQESYNGTVIMWNAKELVFVIPSDQNEDYSYLDYEVPATVAEPAQEGIVEGAVEEAVEAAEEIEESAGAAEEIEETVIEEVEIVEEVVIEEAEVQVYDYYNSEEYKKQQERYEQRRLEREAAKKKQNTVTLAYAKQVLLSQPTRNILQNNSYKKSLGKGNDEVMVWMNDFSQIYKNAFPPGLLGRNNPYDYMNFDEFYKGTTVTARLNFEKDEAVMGIDYTISDELAKIYKPMYEGKFNKNFFSYINEDKLLGYISVNLSTAGILKAYPSLIETMFDTKTQQSENKKAATIAAASSSVTRLFSLLIDEEGAAKILRGDMLLLLTDLREKEVTYTDYEYDEEYNYKKVEKTKTETVPDFLFLFTSEEEKMFRNIMKIGVLEEKVDYENDIYHVGQTRSNPFDIYAMYKDNTVFIGSSVAQLTQIKKGTYPSKLSNTLKKEISKSSTSFYVNGKNIISEIPSEAFPRELRSNIDFLTDNTEDLRVNFSKIKGNTMTGRMVLKTPEKGHKNSLAYFINIIDKLME